jgi:carbon starvation protein CstA
MNILIPFSLAFILFFAAYRIYSRYIAGRLGADDKNKTPLPPLFII